MPRTILKQKARPRPPVKSGGRERFFSVSFESAVTIPCGIWMSRGINELSDNQQQSDTIPAHRRILNIMPDFPAINRLTALPGIAEWLDACYNMEIS